MPPSSQPISTVSPASSRPRRVRHVVLGTLLVLVLATAGLLAWHVLAPTPQQAPTTMGGLLPRLRPGADYRSVPGLSALGLHLLRAEHTRHRQGFAVLSGVSPALSDRFLSRKAPLSETDLRVLESLAAPVLKARSPGDRLVIRRLELAPQPQPLQAGQPEQAVPVWTIRLTYGLTSSQGTKEQVYEGLIGRMNAQENGKDVLILTYGHPGNFHPELFEPFIAQLTWEATQTKSEPAS